DARTYREVAINLIMDIPRLLSHPRVPICNGLVLYCVPVTACLLAVTLAVLSARLYLAVVPRCPRWGFTWRFHLIDAHGTAQGFPSRLSLRRFYLSNGREHRHRFTGITLFPDDENENNGSSAP